VAATMIHANKGQNEDRQTDRHVKGNRRFHEYLNMHEKENKKRNVKI